MKKIIYLKRIVGAIIILIVVAIAVVYIWSALILNETYKVPLTTIQIPSDTAAVREGERLIRIEHCRDCHGEQFSGRAYHHYDYKAELVAPNITSIVSTYSNEELERLIRHGVKKNGRSVYFMPSPMYYELKDESVAKIIAYLRTLKPIPSSPGQPTGFILYPWGRVQIINGKYKAAAARINHRASRRFAEYDTSRTNFGKYLVMTACTNCHGKDLKGAPGGLAPNLIIACAYTEDQFKHLLKTGEGGLGRKNLGLMSIIAKDHLSYLNDKEMNAIYAFLKTLPLQKN